MDGNKRWSKRNNKNQFDSYLNGANKLIKISNYIFKNYKVNYISAFALSKYNLKRSNALINTLNNVFKHFLDKDPNDFNYNFRIIFKGDKSFLSPYLLKKIIKLESHNIDCKKKLFIFINYSGQEDIINTFRNLSLNKFKVNKKNFKNSLITNDTPDPDLLIRTGGYQRISDFMLYQLSFTELFFTKILWPDLNYKNIDNFISKFKKIERKFGL